MLNQRTSKARDAYNLDVCSWLILKLEKLLKMARLRMSWLMPRLMANTFTLAWLAWKNYLPANILFIRTHQSLDANAHSVIPKKSYEQSSPRWRRMAQRPLVRWEQIRQLQHYRQSHVCYLIISHNFLRKLQTHHLMRFAKNL